MGLILVAIVDYNLMARMISYLSHFSVQYCELKACQHWRLDNHCAKNGAPIAPSLPLVANMHDSSICEVRRQANIYRLEHLLEDES